MAKKHEYPQNRSFQARTDAIIQGFAQCRSTLQNIKRFALDKFEADVRRVMEGQIDDALEAAALASRALSGEDE